MALSCVSELRTMCGAAASQFADSQISSLIQAISDHVKNELKRDIEQTSYTEYYSGDNSSVLQLRQFPILSVSRVSIDYNGNFGQTPGAFPVTGDLTPGIDYSIMAGVGGIGSTGCLRRIGQVWWRGRGYAPGKVAPQPSPPDGSILVIYSAGYASVPSPIKMAVNQAVLDAANRIVSGGAMSAGSYQNASISYFSPEMMMKVFGSVQQSLSAYKLPAV